MSPVNRRDFLKSGAAVATGALLSGAPAIVAAQERHVWRMTTCWPADMPFFQVGPGSATDFAKRVEEMSGGRIRISVYAADELFPAFEGFDAASLGRQVQINHGCAYFWAGKTFAAQYFTTVPFGMSFQGHNAWLLQGGGQQLYEETYRPFDLVPLVTGCTGVQPMGWFRKPLLGIEDVSGLRIRAAGLTGEIYKALGASVQMLAADETIAGLQAGELDAAVWVGPYLDRHLGLHRAASHYYSTGWHEPATSTEVVINRRAWDSLSSELQAIMRNCAAACNMTAHTMLEARNAEALDELINQHGVKFQPIPEGIIESLLEATRDILTTHAAADPMVYKVHKSYFNFKIRHDRWQNQSETLFQKHLRDLGQGIAL